MTTDNEPLDRVGMLQLACRQYEDTLVAVHAALDDTLGRDHRTRDDSAAASIHRLAAEAGKRDAVKALQYAVALNPYSWLSKLADQIESGQVTLP